MSEKNIFFLEAILEAIEKIKDYTKEFQAAQELWLDQKSFDAALMQFVVIGESISKIEESLKQTYPQIPWQQIKDFRNIIAHDYFGVDVEEIWDIIQLHLLPLQQEIVKIIKELE